MLTEHPRHRLSRGHYFGLGAYFLTICTANRQALFADSELVTNLTTILRGEFSGAGFVVAAYCFMPDHCHILAVACTATSDLAHAVRSFKGVAAARARKMGIRNLWQRDYYDHIIRSGENLEAVAAYIFENPIRAGLASDPHLWLFSGSFTFDWKTVPKTDSDFVPPWK